MNGSDEPEKNQINNRDVSDSYNHRDVQLVTSILEIYKFFEQARIKKNTINTLQLYWINNEKKITQMNSELIHAFVHDSTIDCQLIYR